MVATKKVARYSKKKVCAPILTFRGQKREPFYNEVRLTRGGERATKNLQPREPNNNNNNNLLIV
jgi:hypothetical protein